MRRWPIHESVPSFSPKPANEVVGAKASIYQWPTTRLTGPISPICDWYVQYLLAGANRTVFNRHRRGLQPWRCHLSTYHSPNFPTNRGGGGGGTATTTFHGGKSGRGAAILASEAGGPSHGRTGEVTACLSSCEREWSGKGERNGGRRFWTRSTRDRGKKGGGSG
jgi:hypothetical protein